MDDPIVLLFDMTDAGYSNIDMEMTKFLVTCLKTYYPGLIGKFQLNSSSNVDVFNLIYLYLDYILVYQMPFIFNGKKWGKSH